MSELRQYRGKRKDNGEWIYGWYVEASVCKPDGILYLIHAPDKTHEVIPSTVGQAVGCEDKNGMMMYAGDKVLWNERLFIVVWCKTMTGFYMQTVKSFGKKPRMIESLMIGRTRYVEIIGTIHTEPDKGGDDELNE